MTADSSHSFESPGYAAAAQGTSKPLGVDCPALEKLEAFVAAAAGDDDQVAVARHLAACVECRVRVKRIAADNELLAKGFRASPAPVLHSTTNPPSKASAVDEIAGYQIVREISRGGQGVVFEALQRSTNRRVALKRIGAGRLSTTRQRRRFDREVECVASLRHPNIVTLYESGVTAAGEAFFVMELVDGLPFDQAIAARRRAGVLPVEHVLRLFAGVCRAVSHAHQRGVIHRDLKPSNILVDSDGEPRVVDFGLARVIDPIGGVLENALTEETHFAGTFIYASPEQFTGRGLTDVDAADPVTDPMQQGDGATPRSSDWRDAADVRSDIYSLGVVLCQALTGATPFDDSGSLEELIRRKSMPPRLGTSPNLPPLDRDTATIVRKSLAVDAARRYQSAAELLEDIERRLDGRPISARADSTLYVLGRLAARHRVMVGVAAAVLLVITALLVAIGTTRTARERQREKAVGTLHAFREALASAHPLEGETNDPSLAAFLARVESNVRTHLLEQPDTAAALLNTLGEIAIGAADYSTAHARFEEALGLGRAHHDGPHDLVAESLHQLGRVAFFRGEFVLAAEHYRQALEMRLELFGRLHPDVASSTSHLGSTLRRLGDAAGAERHLREALSIRIADGRSSATEVASAWNNLGSLLRELGRLEEATAACQRSLEMIESTSGPNDWRVAQALRNLAACALDAGDLGRAAIDLERAVEIWTARVGPNHPSLASAQHELADVRWRLGELDVAAELAQSALAVHQAALGEAHPKSMAGLRLLASIHVAGGRLDEAITLLERAVLLGDAEAVAAHARLSEATADGASTPDVVAPSGHPSGK